MTETLLFLGGLLLGLFIGIKLGFSKGLDAGIDRMAESASNVIKTKFGGK